MDLLDPARVPVMLVYALVALLFLLASAARHQRFHVGHGMVVLMLFVAFSRIFFFDYVYEVFGEGNFYITQMTAGTIPGLGPIYDIGINPPAIFALFYFAHQVVGLDPVVILKVFRLVLGALDIMLVFLIGRRLFPERRLALAAAIVFAWSEVQLSLFEGDQFKNLLGHTFFLAFVVVVMDWVDGVGTQRRGQGHRVIVGIALCVAMILSHQVYPHIILGITGLGILGLAMNAVSKRVLGHRPGMGQAVALIAIAGFGYAFWFREFLPHMGQEGLVALTESDYGFLTLADEIRRPGILLYNIWIGIATAGALLCARRDGERKSVAFLLVLFGFFTVLAKQYLVGLLFQPVRFLMIDGPFLSLFAVYALWRFSTRVTGLGDRLLWGGVALLVLGNFAVMEYGSAQLNLTRNALRVPVSEVPEYLFGGSFPAGQLWLLLLLSAVLVAAVARVAGEPEGTVRVEKAFGLPGMVFMASAMVGVALGVIWLVEPVVVRGMFLQFVVLLFPVWVMGWVPWRAVDLADGPDGGLMQLTMVSVASLLIFVVLWYVVMTSGGGFLDGARWSATLTFLAPIGLLVGLAGTTTLGARWRA
jgi:hypothetical protein